MSWKIRTVVALLLVACCVSIHGDEKPSVDFDIQGMRIGDALTEEFAYNHCPAKDKGKPDITGSDSIEINGKRVFIHFQFDDFKLIGVTLLFEPAAFDSIIEVYTAKFGVQPHHVESNLVKTRLGATYTNVTARWITKSGTFTVSKYGTSVDKGYATLDTPERRRYFERKKTEDTDKLKSKL